jgi:hypothetical protein
MFECLVSLRVLASSAHVAQLVEYVLGKDEVTGSIPVVGSSGAKTQVFFGKYFF